MNFKKLGDTELKVSTICLGTMTWGEQNTQKDAFEQMNYSMESGVNFFDAAEIYPSPCRKETYGETERIIGNWFNQKKIEKRLFWHPKLRDLVYPGFGMVVKIFLKKKLKKLWKIV